MEFALVVPILLLIVFGIINFGAVLAQDLALGNAAREAARSAVVNDRDCTEIQAAARNALPDNYFGMARATPTYTLTGPPCPKPCSGSAPREDITVELAYQTTWLVAFPPFTSGNAPLINGRGVFRCEFS